MSRFFLPAFLIGVLGGPARALTIDLPAETAGLPKSSKCELATAYCSGCHSLDYITTQPPNMPREFWPAEVEKMRRAFGADIPDDNLPKIIACLTSSTRIPK